MFFNNNNNNYRPLPTNRRGLFFEITYARSKIILKSSMTISLFALPLLIWVIINALINSLMLQELNAMVVDDQSAMIMKMFYQQLISNAISIPLYLILSVGLGGIFYVMRNLAWGELKDYKQELIDGIKQNYKNSIFIGLILSVAINSLYVMRWLFFGYNSGIVGIVIYTFLLLLFVLISLFSFTQQVVYNNKFFHLIRNAMILTFSKLFSNLLVIMLTFSPIALLIYFSISLPSLIVLLTLVFIGFGYMALVITLYSHYIFDKFINKKYYTQLVNKGITNKN